MDSTLLAGWATPAAVQITQPQALILQSATAPSLTLALLVSLHALKGDNLKGQMASGENWAVWGLSETPGRMEQAREERSGETHTLPCRESRKEAAAQRRAALTAPSL